MSTVVMAIDGAGPQPVVPIYHAMVRVPSRVILVHVRTPGKNGSRRGEHEHPSYDAQAQRTLLQVRQALERDPAVSVKTVVRDGALVDELLKVSGEERADLMIIGPPRRTGWLKRLKGCAVAEMERRAGIPVIVAPRHPHHYHTSQNEQRRNVHAA